MQAPLPPAGLSANGLACRRGERVLFAGIGFALQPGQAMQVTGANGTGKSSLIRILAGLLRPLAGTVESSGAIGLIDERLALDEHQPLGTALGFWSALDGRPALAREAAELLGLSGLLDVPVRYLSTGQRKRAGLARLIGMGAPVWLLDEPLNGLDVRAARLVEQLVDDHCSAGGIALIASHQSFAIDCRQELAIGDYAP